MGFPSVDGTSNLSGSGEFSAQPFDASSPLTPGMVRCPRCGIEVPPVVRTCPNDGTDLFLRQGQVFAEKYEMLDAIGSGGMGVIYRARHLILDKIVAIKVLHNTNTDPNLIVRFQREAKAASSLSHINVITIYDFGIHNGVAPYMVMDYLPGVTLAQHIEEYGIPSLREALDIVEQVLSALAHAHRKNILHRDLKPSNIMLVKEDGEPSVVKLLDFGLAKLIDRDDQVSLSAMGTAMGSPAYMSPEQSTGLKVDMRSDLYSLGCVVYELLTGSPPLLGDSPMETLVNRLNKRVPSVRDVINEQKRAGHRGPNWEVPSIVELFVGRLLERDPRNRFQSAQDARSYLNSIWEYVDSPDSSYDKISAQTSSARHKTPANRATVKDIPVQNIPQRPRSSDQSGTSSESSRAIARERLDAMSGKPRSSKAEPRTGFEPKNYPPSRSRRESDQFQSEPQDIEATFEQLQLLTRQLQDWLHRFRRSNPGLYWASVFLAAMTLIVIVLILR